MSGAPEVFFEGMPAPVSISLSHRSSLGACAVASENSSLGCDLEFIEPHGEAFAADYFSREEQALITTVPPEDQDCLVALLWSAKESALKVLREGLRLDTRSVIVMLESFSLPAANTWNVLQMRCRVGQIFHGWWSQSAGFVRTLLAIPPPGPPILLAQKRALAMKNAMGQTAG